MKRKILSIFLSLSMLLTTIAIPVLANSSAQIIASTVSVEQGTSSADITISLKNNPGIVSAKLTIDFDSDVLTLTKVEDSGVLGSTSHSPSLASPYNLYWNNGSATENFIVNGVVATLTFNINENAPIGTYPIVISYDEDNILDANIDNVFFETINGSVTITEKPKENFESLSLNNATYTYDGAEKGLTVSGAIPDGANVTYTYNDSAAKPTDAGTYAVKATVTKNGYNDLVLNATMTINPKELTVTGLTASNKEYDGSTDTVVSGGTLNGKVTGDDVSVIFPTSGTFASTNVGNNITVSISDITLSGNDKDSYTLTQPTGLKANISPRPITVTARNYTIKKNNSVPTLGYDITSGSLVSGDTITGSLAVSANGSVLGEFDITQGTLSAGSNYALTYVGGKLNVVEKDAQNVIVETLTAKTYGDSDFALGVTDNDTSLGALSYSSSNTDVATVAADGTVTIKAIGTTNITVSRSGNADYADFTTTQTLTVNKKDITVTARSYTIKKNNAVPTLEYDITSGSLVSGDAITGALSVSADGTALGAFDITQGTLTAGSNYNITFVKGTLTVVDKDAQNVTVDAIATKTYGDVAFVLDVTDSNTSLGALTYTSSNTDVATVAADGTVTIKAAGTTNITVSRGGNADYADFITTQALTVNKKEITVAARNYTIKQNNAVPTLEYDITSGSLVLGDTITGALAVSTDGTILGEYDITQGTISVNNNYNLTFVKGKLTVVDKTPQNIVVTSVGEKTYGDVPFAISVTPDTTANLSAFTYSSSNTDIAEIAADGTITIKAAGTTNITVNEPGNNEYAAFTSTQELVVNKKPVSVTSIDLDAKTVVLEDILVADTLVELDFDKLNLTITGVVDATTSNVTVTNFELKGEKSENYTVSTNSLDATIATDNTVDITITATNGTATGAGTYLKGNNVTVTATANSGYRFSGWYVGDTSVSTNATYIFVADSDKALEAKFSRISTGGGGTSYYTVKFDTNGGSTIKNLSVKRNGIVTEPEAPAKDGYTFAGWYTDKELTVAYDFATKVTKGFTLYAKWTELKEDIDKPDDAEKPDVSETLSFKDVKTNDWFYENVKYVVENNLMNGISENEFAPNNTLTRAMLVTVLYRNAGEPATNRSIPFADVDMGAYYANAVLWAKQNGIVSGVTENEFAPDANITREQIAAIMFRYAQYKGMETVTLEENLHFADSSEISEYAVSAMNWAVGTGLMKGKSATTINPKDNATRAEIAAILQRFIEANK